MFSDLNRQMASISPWLVEELADKGVHEIEAQGAESLAAFFRRSGLCGAAVPANLGGLGFPAKRLSDVLFWVGARSPSLAIMMTMHHHTVAGIAATSSAQPILCALLKQVASARLLVASAFAEGRSGSDVLTNHGVVAQPDGRGFRLSGSKKPCTMSNVMDLMLVGLVQSGGAETVCTGSAIVNAKSEGLSRRPFWVSPYLASSDSHEVVFDSVRVPASQISIAERSGEALYQGGDEYARFLGWFQLLAASAYAGMCARLISEAACAKGQANQDIGSLVLRFEGVRAALESMANLVDSALERSNLTRCFALRYFIQQEIVPMADSAFELLGGLNAIKQADYAYLRSCVAFLAFHPPAKHAQLPSIAKHTVW